MQGFLPLCFHILLIQSRKKTQSPLRRSVVFILRKMPRAQPTKPYVCGSLTQQSIVFYFFFLSLSLSLSRSLARPASASRGEGRSFEIIWSSRPESSLQSTRVQQPAPHDLLVENTLQTHKIAPPRPKGARRRL